MMVWLIKNIFTNFVNIRFDTENAESESCQANCVLHNQFSSMNFCKLIATFVAKSSSDIFGECETRKWVWSGLA